MDQWQLIETATKEPCKLGFTPKIILGFAPDEDGDTLPSCEGHWRIPKEYELHRWDIGWVSSVDPDVPKAYLQPTHWKPLPAHP